MYSVVIPTYRRPKELSNCVDIILKQTIKPKEIIVSGVETDDELKGVLDILKEKCQREGVDFKCILSSTRGIAYQRNRGLENASCEYILMIDDDVEIPPDFVETGLSIFEEKNALIVSGFDQRPPKVNRFRRFFASIFFLDIHGTKNSQRVLPSGAHTTAYSADYDIEAEWISSEVWLIRREVVEKFKFEERLGIRSAREDQDFSYSVKKAFGRGLVKSPRLKFFHNHSPGGREKISKMPHFHVYSQYVFFRKHLFKPKNKIIFAWSMVGLIVQGLGRAFRQGDFWVFYETLRALYRLIRFWNLGRYGKFYSLYLPLR